MPLSESFQPDAETKDTPTKHYFSKTLLQGFLVLLPITIILAVISIIFNFIFDILSPISALLDPGSDDPHWIMHIISLVVLILFIFIVGISIQNRMGRRHFRKFEKQYLKRIPLYGAIYDLVYQFAGVKKLPFSQVVMIDPYKTGVLMTGFVTEHINDNLYTVFVPTAPNPTNGNIYHVPKDCITFLKVNPQDAMRTVVGMGTGTSSLLVNLSKEENPDKKTDQLKNSV